MIVLSVLVQLFGGSMLLLFGVRTVRTGIERAYGAALKRALSRAANPARAAASGLAMAVVLQGATAVTLLSAGLVSAGMMPLATGVALALGADAGSALVIRLLTFDIHWLMPLLLALGGWTYLNAAESRWRNIGRAMLGVGLILLSLRLIAAAVAPLSGAELLPIMAGWLERDLVLALLTGALFTFAMHSSIAAILLCVTLVGAGSLGLSAGVAFVLGANLGSGLIAVWLTRGAEPALRRLPVLMALIRGAAALVGLAGFEALRPHLGLPFWPDGAEGVILSHLAFNFALLLLLPASAPLARLAERLLPGTAADELDVDLAPGHVNRAGARQVPARALSVVRRDTLAMLEHLTAMLAQAGPMLNGHVDAPRRALRELETRQERQLQGLRRFFAELPVDEVPKSHMTQMRLCLEYAVKLKHSGDILTRRILPVAREMAAAGLSFSDSGKAELQDLQQRALSNTFLAFEVLSSGDSDKARDLVAEKEAMSRAEQRSRKRHFRRLTEGNTVSFETSDRHLETSAALKEVNSKVATIAYMLLSREGELMKSKLVDRAAE